MQFHKHHDPYYNIYKEYAGKWLVCSKCGKEEILSPHQTTHEIGWTYNLCPTCGFLKK
jgi:predicted RNA-binding Zn-ribbon protein involved in translation (DUF1610 family)